MNDDWNHDDLWDLLGKAGPVSVSPFFPRNVLREIRRISARPLMPLFLLRWLGAGAFAVLTAGFFLNLADSSSRPSGQADFAAAFDAAAGLDTLIAAEEVSLTNFTADL